jgi:hypothetical protein
MIFWKMLSAIMAMARSSVGLAGDGRRRYHSGLSRDEKGTPMPWVIGIDEAGYGPNLGPLVQAAVPLLLPEDDLGGWETLRSAVRRVGEADDGRLLIDDSKKVYAGPNGLAKLERGVLVGFQLFDTEFASVVRKTTVPWVRDELPTEPWYDPVHPVPLASDPQALWDEHLRLGEQLGNCGYKVCLPEGVIVPAPRFNRVVAEAGSKGEVLTRGLVELLSATLEALPRRDEPVVYLCDKLGGRNHYGPLLQQAFPTGWLFTEKESAEESRYRVLDLGREVRVIFRPRADGGSVSVALASMLAKYLREVCMRQFNRFWAQHVPGLKPTAGYPVDARRFIDAIRPAMAKLGIAEEAVWRVR